MIRRLLTTASLCVGLALAQLATPALAEAKQREHTVMSGQRLGSIAKRYQISVEALCAANGIRPRDIIRPGQKLIIPPRGESPEEAQKRARSAPEASPKAAEKAPAKAPEKPPAVEKAPAKAPEKAAPVKRAEGPQAVHTVVSGQRLGSIAKRYRVTIAAIAYANDLDAAATIKPGQKLVIPASSDEDGAAARAARDAGRVAGLTPPKPAPAAKASAKGAKVSWTQYQRRPAKRGYLTLIGFNSSWKGYVTAPGGKLNPGARIAISKVLDASGLEGGVHPRLIQLLVEVSDTFGGRPIRIVSGHRTASYARASRHTLGHAVDFSVPGVPNEALRDFLLRMDQVGVGYYPNSSFVHLDVRGSKTYWVDHSGPGEAPRYSYIGRGPEVKK
ncbi:MAG: LysM peptidoglycan-binding domain-containing protein [Polyangiaceae bacterium]|nr:LysM peptidoglycan-binding domain-containing protein [Polyangiaceae bacterium]MCW5791327.1 LysM peptidoglycan-binding domain-containing protein [Polyangiaceae bacterium]